MFFKQYYLDCLSHASYMIADETTGSAVVVDPQRDIDHYLADAQLHGLRIEHVLLTHFHADFVAGHLELRDRFGATIHLGRRAEAEFPFHAVGDGDRIELGRVVLEAMETPGHTPESTSFVVIDRDRGETPYAVLTGDTLFIGDVGRPDLLASLGHTADELADMLYDSVTNRLMRLPDDTLVYPAHGAGSMCGKNLGTETVSTLGEQRLMNPALKFDDLASFKAYVTSEQPAAPAYFAFDAVLNRKERPVLDTNLEHANRSLTLDQVLTHREQGAQLLDTRPADTFARGHLVGSLNVPLEGRYATWAGTLLDPERPIVLVADPGREEESAMRLGRIGFDSVVGHLEGGFNATRRRQDVVARAERLSGPDLGEALGSSGPPVLLDVRTAGERNAAPIPGSLTIPLDELPSRLGEIPRDRPVVLVCAGGYRSGIANSVLMQNGFTRTADLLGGYPTWASHMAPSS